MLNAVSKAARYTASKISLLSTVEVIVVFLMLWLRFRVAELGEKQ
jgi:hypothetical protein